MKEQDKKIVDLVRGCWDQPVQDLILVAMRLDKQLKNIVEAGKPFRLFYEQVLSSLPDDSGLAWKAGEVGVTVENFATLDKAMKEVQDE